MTKTEMLDSIYDRFTEENGTCGEGCYLYHYHGADCIHTAFDPSHEIDFYWETCDAHVRAFDALYNPGPHNSHVIAFRNDNLPF